MIGMFHRVRQWFCRHDFKVTKYQALVPGIGWECTKCGKQHRSY